MPTLKIPDSEYQFLNRISELDDSIFANLLKALEGVDTTFLELDISESLAPKVPPLKALELKSFLKSIAALYWLKNARKRTPAQIANDITETIESDKPKSFDLSRIDVARKRIEQLLGIGKAVALTAKAVSVMTAQKRIFTGIRVFSDMRPTFDDDGDTISAAMIVHNINIHYHQDGEHKEFFAAMNTSDVRKVKEAMERAEKKAEALKSFIQKSGVPYFEDKD